MIDFAGLLQPAVAGKLTPQTTYEDAAIFAVEQYSPDYLVLHDRSFPQLEERFVTPNCQLQVKILGQVYGYGQDLVIYACPS